MTLPPNRLHAIRELHATALVRRNYHQPHTTTDYNNLVDALNDLLTSYTNDHRSRP